MNMDPMKWVHDAARLGARLRNEAGRPALRKIALRAAAVVAVATACYLVAANVALRTRWLRDLVSSGPDIELTYASAYSIWPGRVHFRELGLTVQDYNLQFAVQVKSGHVDVSLHELLMKRFRGIGLRGDGTSFRLRHKVHEAEANSPRTAAYPPIPGYPAPALYAGPKPAPLGDAEYNLWEIALDDVNIGLDEVWISEFRYTGAANVRGGFHLRPARWFEVHPALVELRGGVLAMGDRAAARDVRGDISCGIAHTDVSADVGRELFRSITARIALHAALDAAAAQLYLPDSLRASGAGTAQVMLGVGVGQLESGSRVDIDIERLVLETPDEQLSGRVIGRAEVPPEGDLRASLSLPELEMGPHKASKPALAKGVELAVRGAARDLTQPPRLTRVEAELQELTVRSLSLLDPALRRSGSKVSLDGRLEAHAEGSWGPGAPLVGNLQMRVLGGALEQPGMRATFAARVDVDMRPRGEASVELESAALQSRADATIEFDDVRVQQGGAAGPPFRAALRAPRLDVAIEPQPQVDGTWQLNAAPAAPLLSLAIGAPVLEKLVEELLALDRLDATAKLSAGAEGMSLELERARSGGLHARGYWRRAPQRPGAGAFQLTTNVANVGVELRGSEVDTELLVADDWLERKTAAGAVKAAPAAR